MDLLASSGVSLTSCVALEELRITAIYPRHLVTVLAEILPTLPKAGNLSRIILDADGSHSEEGGVDKATWDNLDGVVSEHAEKTSTKHPNRRLTLRFRTDEEGATGERDGWARDLVSSLVFFPKVGGVEYVSRY